MSITKQDDKLLNDLGAYREPRIAFDNAITTNIFNTAQAYNWMYMYSDVDNRIDFFKNIITREYIKVGF